MCEMPTDPACFPSRVIRKEGNHTLHYLKQEEPVEQLSCALHRLQTLNADFAIFGMNVPLIVWTESVKPRFSLLFVCFLFVKHV